MRVTTFAVLTATLLIIGRQQAAEASHIFSGNIQINGTPVASGNVFTDPLITVEVGNPIEFSFDLFNEVGNNAPSNFNVNFFQTSGSLSAPANASVFYPGGFTEASPFVFTFTRTYATTGTFDGFFVADQGGAPNYRFPGGNELTDPSIPFRLEVTQASAVPEPSSLALLGTGLVSLIGYGWRRRKQSLLDTSAC